MIKLKKFNKLVEKTLFKNTTKRNFIAGYGAGLISMGIIAGLGTMSGLWIMGNYKVSEPNKKLVVRGFGIEGNKVTDKVLRLPFQTVGEINMKPRNYDFTIEAMSNEKIPVSVPASMLINIKNDDDSLQKYTTRLFENNGIGTNVDHIIMSIIEGGLRLVIAKNSMEQIFSDRENVLKTIIEDIQEDLYYMV